MSRSQLIIVRRWHLISTHNKRSNIKQHSTTSFVGFYYLHIVTVAAHIGVFWISSKGILFPGTDAFMSILGSFAEIIAGLYGITLAGYTFSLSRMDALMTSYTAMDYVVYNIKKRFKYLIWQISSNVIITLFICIALMYFPFSKEASNSFIYRLCCNEFVLFLCTSISLIVFYSILVIDPNCIQNEAEKQKKILSKPNGEKGNLVEFLSCYDEICNRCQQMIPAPVIHQIKAHKGDHFKYEITLLQKQMLISSEAAARLIRVHHYHECVLSSETMDITQEMCVLAEQVLDELCSDSKFEE